MADVKKTKSSMASKPLNLAWQQFKSRLTPWLERQRLMSFMRTMAWTVPLTVLIWIYAEHEQLGMDRMVAIPIDVRIEAPNRLVTLISPADKNILADLSGPRANLERVKNQLNPADSGGRLVLTIPPDQAPGSEPQFNTLDRLNNQPLFRYNGITITNCNPPFLKLRVDQMVEYDVAVQAPADLANLEAPPLFSPRTVKVRGPKGELGDPSRLFVLADITNLEILRTPGEHKLSDVRLIPPLRGEQVTVSPPTVSATVRVRRADVSLVLPSVPIFVAAPLGVLDKYRVNISGGSFIPNVTVIGPQEQIDRLEKQSVLPRAILEITDKDAGEERSRPVRFELPAGVKASAQDATRNVEFRLQDRSLPE